MGYIERRHAARAAEQAELNDGLAEGQFACTTQEEQGIKSRELQNPRAVDGQSTEVEDSGGTHDEHQHGEGRGNTWPIYCYVSCRPSSLGCKSIAKSHTD